MDWGLWDLHMRGCRRAWEALLVVPTVKAQGTWPPQPQTTHGPSVSEARDPSLAFRGKLPFVCMCVVGGAQQTSGPAGPGAPNSPISISKPWCQAHQGSHLPSLDATGGRERLGEGVTGEAQKGP